MLELAGLSHRELVELRTLTAPAEDRPTIEAAFNELSREVNADRQLAAAIGGSNRRGVVFALSELTSSKLGFESAAQAYGFQVCGASKISRRG